MKNTLALIILDGWGIGRKDESNPIYVAKPPTMTKLEELFPVTSLQASGIAVGLPWGEVGNSEVGHLTIGAGKTLFQYYPKISLSIQSGDFFNNEVLKSACKHAIKNKSSLHLVGLLTNANVHASLEHISALIDLAKRERVPDIKLHLWADGKDGSPREFIKLLDQIPRDLIATIIGRYYAMDRNKNWQLTKTAYDIMTREIIPITSDLNSLIESAYKKGLTEEYLPAIRLKEKSAVRDNDALIFWNFREDSVRQIAEAFLRPDFSAFEKQNLKNFFGATMTPYENSIPAPAVFAPDVVREPLSKVLSDNGKSQIRIAETYKYAHITYFFNGYVERPWPNEYRVLVPSLSTSKPEEHPEMQATAVTDRIIEALSQKSFDFIMANYANPDTIAHTAHYEAAVSAVLTIDREISRLVSSLPPQSTIVITSDHGNIEQMLNPTTGIPESQHDPNPVPFYIIGSEYKGRKFINSQTLETEALGTLADVAPTLLEIAGIPQPEEMTGRSLLEGLI